MTWGTEGFFFSLIVTPNRKAKRDDEDTLSIGCARISLADDGAANDMFAVDIGPARHPVDAKIATAFAWMSMRSESPDVTSFDSASIVKLFGGSTMFESFVDTRSYIAGALGISPNIERQDIPSEFRTVGDVPEEPGCMALADGLMFLRVMKARYRTPMKVDTTSMFECELCKRLGGSLMDGHHTYGGNCQRRRAR